MRERWKEPREGSEIDPEIVCLQSVGALRGDGVLFVERSSELISYARLSQLTEPQWKRAWIGRWHRKMSEVYGIRPETKWPNHEQVEATVTGSEGPNRRTQQSARMTCG